jgi:hypothetical protein
LLRIEKMIVEEVFWATATGAFSLYEGNCAKWGLVMSLVKATTAGADDPSQWQG